MAFIARCEARDCNWVSSPTDESPERYPWAGGSRYKLMGPFAGELVDHHVKTERIVHVGGFGEFRKPGHREFVLSRVEGDVSGDIGEILVSRMLVEYTRSE